MSIIGFFAGMLNREPTRSIEHNRASSEITLQLGEVKKVNVVQKTVTVQSYFDGSYIPDIPLDPAPYHKYIPIVGQQVLIQRSGNSSTRILTEFGTPKEPFSEPLQPGETMIKSIGHSYLYLDKKGNAMLSDSDLSNAIRLLSRVGIVMNGNALSIDIQGIGKLNILKDDDGERVELIKVKGKGKNTKPSVKITLKNDKILIDGASVELGLSSDSNKGGVVVSQSGVPGPHNFCVVTGAPIPCSQVVKASIIQTPPTST